MKACYNNFCHESYFPYFYGNDHCKFMFEDLKKDSSGTSGTINLFEDASNLFGNEKPAGNYSKDEWTERLHIYLGLNNIDAELTAYFRGANVKKLEGEAS